MCRPFVAVVEAILNKDRNRGATVVDTHARQYLGVYSPDITIAISGLRNPDAHCDRTEARQCHPRRPRARTSIRLRSCDPCRSRPSTLTHRHAIQLCRYPVRSPGFPWFDHATLPSKRQTSFTRSRTSCTLSSAPTISAHTACVWATWCALCRIGTSSHSVVCEFDAPQALLGPGVGFSPTKYSAVKRSSDQNKVGDIQNEINILTKIKSHGGCSTIARLVYASPENDELGVMSVGKPVDPMDLSELSATTILADVLAALDSKNIIHRDVRIENVVMYEGRARLIGAVELPAPENTPYWGGYLCCPHELIGDFNLPYTPSKCDDRLSFVMMAFPHTLNSVASIRVAKRSAESYRLTRFWARLKVSSVWGLVVRAAEEGDVMMLGRIGDVFAIL